MLYLFEISNYIVLYLREGEHIILIEEVQGRQTISSMTLYSQRRQVKAWVLVIADLDKGSRAGVSDCIVRRRYIGKGRGKGLCLDTTRRSSSLSVPVGCAFDPLSYI